MNKLGYSLLLLLYPLAAVSQPARGDSLASVRERASYLSGASLLPYANPAVQRTRYASSLSEVWGGYSTAREDRYRMETGDSYHGGNFHAKTFTQLEQQAVVWGEAVYLNGERKNLKWNETADYDRLYPYVTADSIGGFMKQETYFLQGGFAQKTNRWSYGVQVTYQSESAYRDRDPRPKNDMGLINATLGATMDWGTRYAIGLYAFAEKYNMEQSVQFMNPKGKSVLYHLTGLGMDYVRFAGSNNSSVYKGRTLAAGITLTPLTAKGLAAAFYLEQYHVQKQLMLRNAYVPLNDVNQSLYKGEVSYRGRKGWVRIGASYRHRIGKERIYDDGTQNYHEISSSEPYQEKAYTASLCGAYEGDAFSSFTWGVQPSVAFISDETTYALPFRRTIFQTLYPRVDVHLMRPFKKMWLELGGDVHAETVLHADLYLEDEADFAHGLEAVHHNYDAFSAGGTGFGVYATWHMACRRYLRSIYLKPAYTCTYYTHNWKNYGLTLSVGLAI